MTKVLNITFFLLISIVSNAQDVGFTQFFSNPIYLNPALTGQYNGNYRISSSYRSQWFSGLENPYQTFSFSGDLKFKANRNDKYSDEYSAGLLFLTDQTRIFDLNTNQLSFSGSYTKYLGTDYDQYLGAGLSLGIIQKSINYGNITFQDQFNAINGYTLATGENLPTNNFAVGDITLGIHYSLSTMENLRLTFGVAYAHLNSPNESFYDNTKSSNPQLITKSAVDSKTTLYGHADWKYSTTLKIQPRAMILVQGDHNQAVLGSNFRMAVNINKRQYFHLGGWTRFNNHIDGLGLSTIMLSAGFEIDDVVLGISYDHNVKDLLNERAGLNTFEISFQYFGESVDDSEICPKF